MHQVKVNNTSSQALKYLQISFFSLLILYFGRSLFVPMFYGLLIALVAYPVSKKIELKGVSRSLSITIVLSIVILLFIALLGLLGWQISLFRQDIPDLVQRIKPLIPEMQQWIHQRTSLTLDIQDKWLRDAVHNSSGKIGGWLQATASTTISTAFALFLVPIYSALFLYHRGTFVRFLRKAIGERQDVQIDKILDQTVQTYFNYIVGMIKVYIIVGVLNSIGLLALGIEHAILFGMLTAIMTIIPYVGIIVSAMLPISVAFITKDSVWYPLGVVAVFSFVQYLEGNVIFPKIVGTQLNVSTWATLVAIILGGIIWGVSGMILFIPFVAILKIITDNVNSLSALNILLNRDMSSR